MADDIVAACARVLRDWDWAQRPAAVVVVPSRHRPDLVSSLGARLAALGRLENLGQLDLVDGGPTGHAGGNSAGTIRGELIIADQMTMASGRLGDRVLLVDDLVDSRWTLTVAGAALRAAGADAVLPFALAQAG